MLLTTTYRVIKTGIVNFWRNGWLTISSIAVIALTLFTIGVLLLINVAADRAFQVLEDKVDISAYFKIETPEANILRIKSELGELVEVRNIEYVSRESALARFKEEHRENPLIMQSLEELGTNPLQASLNVRAFSLDGYPAIDSFLASTSFGDFIDKVNYKKNEKVISRIYDITGTLKNGGVTLSLVLALITILVTFNAMRLSMYAHKKEIEIMRLVGATNWYIRWPFIIEGALAGVFGGLLALFLLWPAINFASPKLAGFLEGFSLQAFFNSHLFSLLGIEIVIGLCLTIIGSMIAIRKYLKV